MAKLAAWGPSGTICRCRGEAAVSAPYDVGSRALHWGCCSRLRFTALWLDCGLRVRGCQSAICCSFALLFLLTCRSRFARLTNGRERGTLKDHHGALPADYPLVATLRCRGATLCFLCCIDNASLLARVNDGDLPADTPRPLSRTICSCSSVFKLSTRARTRQHHAGPACRRRHFPHQQQPPPSRASELVHGARDRGYRPRGDFPLLCRSHAPQGRVPGD